MTNDEVRAVQRDLARSMEGPIIDIGDCGYRNTVGIDNGRVTHEPYLVAIPSSTDDVVKVTKYCHDHKIRLTTKSGGHSAAGYSLNSDGIVLDMVRLNTISSINGGTGLTAGMGTRWIQLYRYLQQIQSDRIAVGGGCSGVGLGGFLLGGGYSFISRSYGLGADNVKRMEFVTVNGDVHNLHNKLTNKDELDLLWALRGAGGGNFGIVTEVDLDIHKTPAANMMMGQLTFPFYRIKKILKFYNNWVLTLPNEMAVYGMLRKFPDQRRGGESILSLRLLPIYNGKISDGMKLLKPLINLLPTNIEFYAMTLPEWENFIGNGTLINGRSAYIRSAIMPAKSLTTDVAEICMKYMGRLPSNDSYIVWTHTGGKIKDIDRNSSCFAHRDAEFVFELKSIWDSSAPQDTRSNVEWAVNFFDELETHAQGAYINYIDPLLLDWQTKYYRETYKRLLDIKAHWDPKGQFDFQQGIGSGFTASRVSPLDLSPLTRT